MIKKYLLLRASALAISTASANTEYQLASSFKYNENATLDDLVSKPTVVRAMTHKGGSWREDGAPRDIDNASIAYSLRKDMDAVRAKVLASDAFLYDQTYDVHREDVEDVVYAGLISYRPLSNSSQPIIKNKDLKKYLQTFFSAEMRELGASLQKNLWSKDKSLGSDWSVALNAYDRPSVTFLYQNGKSSSIVLPLHSSNRLMSTESFLKKGVSFNKLPKEDVVLFDLLKSIFLDKKDPYAKKSLKGNVGAYLNGASNPKSLATLNRGLRPEEIYLRDFLLYYTFHEGKYNKSRLSHVEKTKVPQNIVDFWRQNRGKPLTIYNNQYDIGLNYNNALSLIVRTSKAALPIFKEDRNRTDFALPYAYTRSEENRLSGLFWLKRHLNKAFILNDALLGLSDEEHNPYKKSLLKIAKQLKDGLIINVKDKATEETLEMLNFLISSSFIYNQTAIDWIKTNRHHNPTYFDTLLSFIKDFRDIQFRVLEPIPPLNSGLIARENVPPVFVKKFEERQYFYGRDADGKSNKNILRKVTKNYHGNLATEQLHGLTNLVVPVFHEDYKNKYALLPRNVEPTDEDRTRGSNVIDKLSESGFTFKEMQQILNDALYISPQYTSNMVEPVTALGNYACHQTIGHAIKHMEKRDGLEDLLKKIDGVDKREKAIVILQNADK